MTDENRLESRHVVIDDHLIGTRDSICLVADVKGDRFKEVMIGSMSGRSNLVWYEYPDWKRHAIAALLEVGGVVIDINGDGDWTL